MLVCRSTVFTLLMVASCPLSTAGEDAPAAEGGKLDFDQAVARLTKLGLMITADSERIDQVTSEAAYFMFAQRKEHQPRSEPLKWPDKGHWLDGKPLFLGEADREAIYPLFRQLVQQAAYDTVWIYDADVHYGVDSYARFTLYKLGYRDAKPRDGRQKPVLLGDADYVMRLP